MTQVFILEVATVLISLVFGLLVSYKFAGRFFEPDSITRKNALSLLLNRQVEEWNAFRILDKNWKPNFPGVDFSQFNLSGANFKEAKFDNSSFFEANLDNSDLSMASLEN